MTYFFTRNVPSARSGSEVKLQYPRQLYSVVVLYSVQCTPLCLETELFVETTWEVLFQRLEVVWNVENHSLYDSSQQRLFCTVPYSNSASSCSHRPVLSRQCRADHQLWGRVWVALRSHHCFGEPPWSHSHCNIRGGGWVDFWCCVC